MQEVVLGLIMNQVSDSSISFVSDEDQAHGVASLYGILNNVHKLVAHDFTSWQANISKQMEKEAERQGQEAAARAAVRAKEAQRHKEQAGVNMLCCPSSQHDDLLCEYIDLSPVSCSRLLLILPVLCRLLQLLVLSHLWNPMHVEAPYFANALLRKTCSGNAAGSKLMI